MQLVSRRILWGEWLSLCLQVRQYQRYYYMFKVLTLLIKKIFGKYTYICPIVSFHKNRFILYVHLEREYQEILFELKKNSKTLFSCQDTAEFLKRSIKYVWTSFHGCCDLRYTSDLAYLVMNWLTFLIFFFVKLANKIFFIFFCQIKHTFTFVKNST